MNNEILLDKYLDYLKFEKKLSLNTINSYGDNIKVFLTFLNNKKLVDVSSTEIRFFLVKFSLIKKL